jgi:hypothetical protein
VKSSVAFVSTGTSEGERRTRELAAQIAALTASGDQIIEGARVRCASGERPRRAVEWSARLDLRARLRLLELIRADIGAVAAGSIRNSAIDRSRETRTALICS